MQIKKIRKDSSENNQENKSRSLTKKLSFLWVIIVAALIHVIIKNIGIDYSLERSAIFILWVVAILVVCYMASYDFDSKFRKNWNLYDTAEFDIIGCDHKPTKKRLKLEKNGKITTAIVQKVSVRHISSLPSVATVYIVEYAFESNGKLFIKIKKLLESAYNFYPSLPKENSLIMVLYDESNPNDSIIVHEPADKVPWYKLQKKYKIKIITNNTNN